MTGQPANQLMLAATGAWAEILEQVDGARVASQAEAAVVVRAVADTVTALPPQALRMFAVMTATNLLAAGQFIDTDPQFLRHLLERAVRTTTPTTPREDQP